MKKLSVLQKTFVISGVISFVGLIVFGVIWAVNASPTYGAGMFLGWLLGLMVGYINFSLIILQTRLMEKSVTAGGKAGSLAGLFALIRLVLIGVGLGIAGYLMYGKGNPILNIWTAFAGMLSINVGIRFSGATKPWAKDSPLNNDEAKGEDSTFVLSDLFSKDDKNIDDGDVKE